MSGEHESRAVVERALLRPSPFNPRKTFDEADLRELAASFATHGVLQPLLVRPVGEKAKFDPKRGWSGYDHFEVVCGHRRLKAAELADLPRLPVTVRALTDTEAREIQMIENVQRADVPPSEEAAGYRELVELVGQEGTAERTGTPLQRVRDLVRLASLPAWFLAAVDRGDVPVSTAALVARVPGAESRAKAAACVALGVSGPDQVVGWTPEGDAGGPFPHPLSSRDAKELIRTHFSRQLKEAPFSRKALDLVPEAGSCDACPKRAGNDPELAAEGVRADVCTDPDCFELKVRVYQAQEVTKAAKRHGATFAEDLDWKRWEECPKGWCLLAGPVGESELNADGGWTGKKGEQIVGDLIGSWPGEKKVAFHPKTGKPHVLVRTTHARKVLEHAGLMSKKERAKKEKAALSPRGEVVKADDGPYLLYRVTLNPEVMPAVEFDSLEGTDEEDLREQAVSAFMDWFDGVDWSDPKLIPRPFAAFERVPEAEASVLKPRSCRVCGCTEADCRQCVEKTGQPCSWVEADLCSACVPATAPEVRTPAPGPIVCAPVGSLKLRDVPKFPGRVCDLLEPRGVVTLLDLDARSEACRKGRRELTPHNLLRTVEAEFGLSLSFDLLMAAGDAIADHMNIGVYAPAAGGVATKPAKKKGKVKA